MSKYPTVITEEVLRRNEGVSDAVARRDIRDTNDEIAHLEREFEGWRLIAEFALEESQRRMAHFKVENRRNGIQDRCEFVEFLESLLDARIKKNAPCDASL